MVAARQHKAYPLLNYVQTMRKELEHVLQALNEQENVQGGGAADGGEVRTVSGGGPVAVTGPVTRRSEPATVSPPLGLLDRYVTAVQLQKLCWKKRQIKAIFEGTDPGPFVPADGSMDGASQALVRSPATT